MNGCFKFSSYISSLAPLWIYVIIRMFFPINSDCVKVFWWQYIIMGGSMLLLVTSGIYTIKITKKMVVNEEECNKKIVLDDIVAHKDLSYVIIVQNTLPVISLIFELSIPSVVFMIVLTIVLSIIWVKNDLYYQNLFFDLMNIRVYSAKVAHCDREKNTFDRSDMNFEDSIIIAKKGNNLKKFEFSRINEEKDIVNLLAFNKDKGIYYIYNDTRKN